ncbi:MAG TPA: hypothetical protein VMB03_11125 [Bryobacteraceae bacterium]|nr:hypothetical protein [Bryobacteraceae bacterium]
MREIESLRQDVVYAIRMPVKSPGFAAIAVFSVGMGGGMCSAVQGFLTALE